MLVPRRRPESAAARIRELPELSAALFARDLAFFYSAFVVEEALS
jgi:S-adenosylmethionine-diacylglycerol 3-amino-3-carboxypropyl transferase